MTINPNKWINTIPNKKSSLEEQNYDIYSRIWEESVTKKKRSSPFKIYSSTATIFIIGLIFVSTIKNKTRELQNEINDLNVIRNNLKLEIYQANLDYEVIASPKNISRLANQYLDKKLIPYKNSQIKNLNESPVIKKSNLKKKEKIYSLKKVNIKIAKKIETKKNELKILQKKISEPKKIPSEVKIKLAKKIKEKKIEIKKLYSNPQETLKDQKVRQWAVVQLAKVFLGIPIVPGK